MLTHSEEHALRRPPTRGPCEDGARPPDRGEEPSPREDSCGSLPGPLEGLGGAPPGGRHRTVNTVKPPDVERILEREGDDDEDIRHLLRPVQAISKGHEQVLREDLEAHLRSRAQRDRSCRNIPFIFLYFLLFDLMLLSHERFSEASQVERNLKGMMTGSTFEGYSEGPPGSPRLVVSGHKALSDIDTVDDVYTFLLEALVPQLVPPLGAGPDLRHRAYRYHQLIGGLQLEQTRRGRRACASLYPTMGPKNEFKVNPLLTGFHCYGAVPNDEVCYGPGAAVEGFCRNGSHAPGRRLRRSMGFAESLESLAPRLAEGVSGPLYSLTLHEGEGVELALRRVRELRDASWLDTQSSWLGLKFFMMNPDLAVYSITQINIHFLETGELLPIVEITTFLAEPYQHKGVLAVDACWGLLLAELLLTCLWELLQALRRRGGRLRAHCLSLWTWTAWACAVLGVAAVALWAVYLEKLEAVKGASLAVATERPAGDGPHSPEVLRAYAEAVRRLHDDVGGLAGYLAFLRFFLSCYNLLLVVRFFEAFQTQPRLAMVAETFLECLPDFLHFMVVFVTILLSFGTSATFLFGHRLPEYSRLLWSIERCLFMLFGSLDYNRLAGEHPATAFIWFVSFMTLMCMVMLNMSVAVIMDVYAGKKSKFDLSESITQQLFRCQRRRRVATRDVLRAVEGLQGAMVSGADLARSCGGLGARQAEKLVHAVAKDKEDDYSQGTSISDTTKLIMSLKRNVQQISEQVEAFAEVRARTRAQLGEVVWHQGAATHEEPLVVLDPGVRRRFTEVERRLDQLEELLDDALAYAENRSRGLRDGLRSVEEWLRARPPAA